MVVNFLGKPCGKKSSVQAPETVLDHYMYSKFQGVLRDSASVAAVLHTVRSK